MTVTTNSSATKLVRDTLKAHGENPDYDVIAQSVLDQISPTDYRDYLFQFIRLRVSNQIADDRNTKINALKNYTSKPLPPQETAPQTFIEIDAPPAPIKTNTAKRDAIIYAALAERVFVPYTGFVLLGSLTFDNCVQIAADRRDRSKQMNDSGDMYESFGRAIQDNKVTTLEEIPQVFAKLVNNSLL